MADLIVVHFFIYLTVRPSTDGKRAPLTAINLQAAGSPQQAPPTYIAKMWKLMKFRKNVIFSRNHTDVNPDHWTITKKIIRTTIHENFSKMKNLKVDRWALSLTHYFLGDGTVILEAEFLTLFYGSISWALAVKIDLSSMPQNPVYDRSTLVQVMGWCLMAPSH